MRRDLLKKMKHLETNHQIGATQCLAIATINLPLKGAFLMISLYSCCYFLPNRQNERNAYDCLVPLPPQPVRAAGGSQPYGCV